MKLIQPVFAVAATAALAVAFHSNDSTAPATKASDTVSGKVTYDGEVPEAKPLTISTEASKGCCEGGKNVDATDRKLLVGEGGGIANVVVTVEVKDREWKPSDEAVVLDQKECRFEPHVAVVPVGQTVSYLNSDAVSHNIHTYAAKNGTVNRTVPAGEALEQTYDKPEVVKVACDIHPWMSSYVVVTDAAVATITKADGTFELPTLPAGTYKVNFWHEELGKNKADLVVKEDGTAEPIEVKWAAKKKGKGGRRAPLSQATPSALEHASSRSPRSTAAPSAPGGGGGVRSAPAPRRAVGGKAPGIDTNRTNLPASSANLGPLPT